MEMRRAWQVKRSASICGVSSASRKLKVLATKCHSTVAEVQYWRGANGMESMSTNRLRPDTFIAKRKFLQTFQKLAEKERNGIELP